MLDFYRNIIKTKTARFVIFLILISFVLWGVSDVVKSNYNPTVVKFKKSQNITLYDLEASIRSQMKMYGQSFEIYNDEKLKELKISTLNKLINENLISYLAKSYKLDMQDKTIIDTIKDSASFQKREGKFDIQMLQGFLKANGITESEYINIVKQNLMQKTILNTFTKPYIPSILLDFIAKKEAEEKVIDYFVLDLKQTNPTVTHKNPSLEDLSEFYHNNSEILQEPERRLISYIIIPPTLGNNSSESVSTKEIEKYLEKNSKEFLDITNEEAKAAAKEVILAKKGHKDKKELLEKIDDEVSAGTKLEEISKQLSLQHKYIKNISLEELMVYNGKIKDFANEVFTQKEYDISQIYELEKSQGEIIFSVEKIHPAYIPDIKNIKDKLKRLWLQEYLDIHNRKLIQTIAKKIEIEDYNKVLSVYPFIKLNKNIVISNKDFNKKLPKKFQQELFKLNNKALSPIFFDENKAFIAVIKQSYINQSYKDKILSTQKELLTKAIQNSIFFEQIVPYLKKEEKVQINYSVVK